jgi:Protein of unknown function (DUF429)
VLTLGVDLSADAKKTASCLIEWTRQRAVVRRPETGLGDEALLDRMTGTDEHPAPEWIGIDAPFGWPVPFVAAVRAWENGGAWPARDGVARKPLRYRATDLHCEEVARRGLSVSTDLIGVTAMRCAALLTALATRRGLGRLLDRTGADQVVEVYPGAALPLWSGDTQDARLDPRGYKGGTDHAKRRALVAGLLRAAPWLDLDHETRSLCESNDDALDSLLAALVTRAAALGRTLPPTTREQREAARVEGWLHLPARGSLAGLHAPRRDEWSGRA